MRLALDAMGGDLAPGPIVAGAVALRVTALAPFDAYPVLHARVPAGGLVLCGALVVAALAPFADRRGIETWTR